MTGPTATGLRVCHVTPVRTRGASGRLRWVSESSGLPPSLTADGHTKGRGWWWAANRAVMVAEAIAAGWTVTEPWSVAVMAGRPAEGQPETQPQPLTDAQRRAIVADVLRVIEWPMREADYAVVSMLADMGDPEATPEAEADALVEAAAEYAWDHLLGEPANPKPKAIVAKWRRGAKP